MRIAFVLGAAAVAALQLPPIAQLEGLDSLARMYSAGAEARTFGDIRIDTPLDSLGHPIDVEFLQGPPTPDVRAAFEATSNVMHMHADSAREYECFVPRSGHSAPVEAASSLPLAEVVLEDAKRRVRTLGRECLRMHTANWEYEFCPLKHVRQLHREPRSGSDGITGVQRINIGGLELVVPVNGGSQNAALAAIARAIQPSAEIVYEYLLGRFIPDESHERIVDGHLVQTFLDGDVCGGNATEEQRWISENTPEGSGPEVSRQTDVHFECVPLGEGDRIIDVREVSFCQYVIRVGSPRFCTSAAGLGNSGVPRVIRCFSLHPDTVTSPQPFVDQKPAEPAWIAKLRRMADARGLSIQINHTPSGDPAADAAAGEQMLSQWMQMFQLRPDDDPLHDPAATNSSSEKELANTKKSLGNDSENQEQSPEKAEL